jgi:hypothetical protein
MRRERRVQHLDWLEAEGLDAVEHPLARPEKDGNGVQSELVDHARRKENCPCPGAGGGSTRRQADRA